MKAVEDGMIKFTFGPIHDKRIRLGTERIGKDGIPVFGK